MPTDPSVNAPREAAEATLELTKVFIDRVMRANDRHLQPADAQAKAKALEEAEVATQNLRAHLQQQKEAGDNAAAAPAATASEAEPASGSSPKVDDVIDSLKSALEFADCFQKNTLPCP